jgi:hypothetical protein
MTRAGAIKAVGVALKEWRRGGGPRLRPSFVVEEGPPEAKHLIELGIERDWKGAAVMSDPPGTWWGCAWERLVGGPRAVIFIFADNCRDALDVRRVVWHELAHVCGLDETECEELGYPSWSKQD